MLLRLRTGGANVPPELVFEWPKSKRAFGGLRATVAQAREKLGDAAIDRALTPDASLLSLALPALAERLDAEELAKRERASGAYLGALPNVVTRKRAVLVAWGDAIARIIGRVPSRIVIPSANDVDGASLETIKTIVSAVRRSGGSLEVAIRTRDEDASSDALSNWLANARLVSLAALRAFEGATIAEDDELPVSGARDDSGDGASVDAMEAAFFAHGYDSALEVARALIDKGDLDAKTARRVHLVAGLSVLNLDPLTRDAAAVGAMAEHFAAALEGEPDPLVRAHIGYRLCLVHARGKGDASAALAIGDEAVRTAEGSSDPRARFFEAWARNGRAFARLRAGNAEGAASDCETALERVAGDDLEAVIPMVELRVARVLMANNRAKIAAAIGDAEALAKYRSLTRDLAGTLPVRDRPAPQWFSPPDEMRDLGAFRDHWEASLREAHDRLDAQAEAAAAHALGVLSYRLGDASKARSLFETAWRIFRALEGDPGDIFTEALNAAVAAYRIHDFDGARERFEALVADPIADDDARAELSAALAMVVAAAGDRERARALAESSLKHAETTGDPGIQARVLRSAGEAALARGDRDEARALLDRGLGVASAGDVAIEDRFGLLVARLDLDVSAELLRDALEIAIDSLADANAWWDLARLFSVIDREKPALDAADAATLKRIADYAKDRPDCARFA